MSDFDLTAWNVHPDPAPEARPAHWGSVADLQAAYSELAAKLDETETALMAAEAKATFAEAERDQLRAEEAKARAQEKQAFYELGLTAAERDDARVGVANLGAICEQVMAERDAMRDVVEAARACVDQIKQRVHRPVDNVWLRDETRALVAAVDAYDTHTPAVGAAHAYLSTACHHGHHADCATGGTRWDGTSKTPAQCKWCTAKCECTGCDHKALVMDGDQPGRG